MKVIVIRSNRLNILELPEVPQGSFWITDYENGKKLNLINIEARDNAWYIISNHDAYVMQKEVIVPEMQLQEYYFYTVENNYRKEKFLIYCSPVYDKSFRKIEASKEITVGSGSENITYKLQGVPSKAFSITHEENKFYLNVLDKNTVVYLNNNRVLSRERVEYGDIIFIYGLKLILMRDANVDYIYFNNPNNLISFNTEVTNIVAVKDEFVEDNAELPDDSFSEVNYFYRTPHFYKTVSKMTVNVDVPPSKKEEDSTPAILTIGPMLTMSLTSVVSLISTVSSINSGSSSVSSSMTSIVMCVVMLASCLLWPLLTRAFQRFSDKRYENKRQRLYKKYINKKEVEIDKELENQKVILIDNNFSVKQSQEVILGHNVSLWQRRITDEDFLTLPIGIGDMPMQVDINFPEEKFSMTDDNLLDIAHELGNKKRVLTNVPILFSFYTNQSVGIVGDTFSTKAFMDRVVLQIVSNYSYDEVKLVTFTSLDNESSWEYMKPLPHSWSNDKSVRFFGSSNDDYRELIYVLEKIYNERKQSKNKSKFTPHYVIVTDAIKSIDNYDFIKNIMSGESLGFSIIMLVDKLSAIPNECRNFINVSRDECAVFSSVLSDEVQKFKIDPTSVDDIYRCSLELANIPIDIKSDAELRLPDTLHFLEMYQVGKVEQLNCKDRWAKSNPIVSLQTPVGVSQSGDLVMLDLHEKYHGPHGLIAGTTGSGKSEFIISYVLSLAINYHPYEVQVILIDYKGGGLAGAFTNDRFSLPHLAGTITNLDGNELNRTLASIQSEIKRRQAEFNKAKEIAQESTMDIYKYQRLWREKKLGYMEPIAHLFIISDEFAELKEQQPDFMDSLISAARVGRSLGIHLILATQKPGGVVDAQIWSNTRFRVCLKVQDTSDSQEVLKKPDAAFLKKTGRFYLQVGYDEVYTLGQAAWAGGQYFPDTSFRKEIDTSVNVINNIGLVTSTKDIEKTTRVEAQGEELPNIVEYLANLAKEENISIRKLWLEKIPAKIYIDNIKEKYSFEKKSYYLDVPIGAYDDPSSQSQHILTIPFSRLGNALIYGIAGSGKELFLTSLIYSCMVTYSAEEVNFYIMDFGAETLRMFRNSPHVADIVYLSDTDKIVNLFKLLKTELEKRKALFANFGGNYQSYIEKSNEKIPNIIVILNNFEAFNENYEDYVDTINQLSRDGFKYGVFFCITTSSENGIRIRTKQNFSLIYALQQNNDLDFSSILGNARGKIPAKIKGRGLFKKDEIYEFQTAIPADEDNLTTFIEELCRTKASNSTYKKASIPVLPKEVNFDVVEPNITRDGTIVVGVNKNTLEIEKLNLKKNPINIICAYEMENIIDFLNALFNQVIYTNYYELMIINSTEIVLDNPKISGKVYTQDFDKIVNNIADYIDKLYKIYEDNNMDATVLDANKKYMCVIFGLHYFINKLSNESKDKLKELLKKDNAMGSFMSFIIIDNPDIIKGVQFDEWFKSNVDTSRGVWIGNGITDQTLLKVAKFSKEDREEITEEFGYIVNNSKISKIKVLDSFNDAKQ